MRKGESHKRVFICSAYLLDRDILLPKYSQSTAAIRFLDIGQKLPIIIQTAMFLLNSRRNKVEFSLCILVPGICVWGWNNYAHIIGEALNLLIFGLFECTYNIGNFSERCRYNDR